MRMNRELNAVLHSADFAAKLRDVSFEAMPGTPADMKHASVRERDNWRKVIEQSGASAE
jgi:tripartite-type tricarboxylate transporter receptor subunit TctC